MRFLEARFMLFAFAVLSDVYCSDDLDAVYVGKVGESCKLYCFKHKFLFYVVCKFVRDWNSQARNFNRTESITGFFLNIYHLEKVFFFGSLDVDYQRYQDLDTFLSVECEKHEEYSECFGDRTCQKTCENMDQWERMSCARRKVCIRGCICEDGYVRDNYSGVCIRENNCPRVRH